MKILLRDGHIVYGGARRVKKMDLIKQTGAKVLSLEITNDDSMVDCITTVIKNEGKIDVLINSAGFVQPFLQPSVSYPQNGK